MVARIVTGFNPILMEPTVIFPFDIFDSIDRAADLASLLTETMVAAPGIGLAANQIGYPWRVFAFQNMDDGEGIVSAVFNPIITGYSEKRIVLEEGCLSFLGLLVEIERPTVISVTYQDYMGKTYENEFGGMNSRIWQHEIDHLDGVLYFNRLPRIERDKEVKKWRKQNGLV